MNFMTTVTGVGLGLAVVAGGIFVVAATQQPWAGTGTVVERVNLPADFLEPETFRLTVRDRDGKEHKFKATERQYDAAEVGKEFTVEKR